MSSVTEINLQELVRRSHYVRVACVVRSRKFASALVPAR